MFRITIHGVKRCKVGIGGWCLLFFACLTIIGLMQGPHARSFAVIQAPIILLSFKGLLHKSVIFFAISILGGLFFRAHFSALEFYVDDGVVLGLGIFVNLHKLFCDKTVVSGCVDASLDKVLVRYPNAVLVVDTVDECLSKRSVIEERLEWKIIFSSFDGCKSTLNDWKNPSSSVDARCGRC